MNYLKEHKILIVDDSENWRDLLSQVLEDHHVTAVGSVAEALKELALHYDAPFDVAIVDKSLTPDDRDDETGLDLAREIKSIVADCQIIILTGFEDVSSAITAFKDVEVFHYLRKFPEGKHGFDNEELRNTVLRAILAAPQPDRSVKARKKTQVSRPEAVTILHLSDLHFGENHRFFKDKRYPGRDAPTLQKALITSLENSGKRPDIIVVSGDLTERGDSWEFRQVRSFFNALRKRFKLNHKQFIVVPGNHDVRWSDDSDIPGSNERDKLAEYRDFYELFHRQAPIEQAPLCRIEAYRVKDKPDIAIIGFDSCVIENPETAGVGYIGTTQLTNALAKLKGKIKDNIDCIKVAVLHHHLLPVAYLEKLPRERKKFSLVVDATRILARLQEEGFALVLHGHQHQPFCAELRFPLVKTQNSKPLAILGMGSTGIKPTPELVGGTRNNHYGILEISKTSPSAPLRVDVSWYRAAGNEPEEAFEIHKEFTLRL